MMRLRGLVLGNSHAACLREAWARAPVRSIQLEFLAAHAEKMDGLAFEGERAVARTADLCETLDRLGMRKSFRLQDYDFYVATACQFSIFRALEVARTMTVWSEGAGDRKLVSEPCFRETLADSLRSTTAFRLVRGLAGAAAPVLLLPQPFPHQSVLDRDSTFPGFRRIDRAGRGAWLVRMFHAACDSAASDLAAVLHQPVETRVRDICTNAAYSDGSVMLAAGRRAHKVTDVLHANIEYGARQLDQIAAALEQRHLGADRPDVARIPQAGATCRVGVLG